MTQIVAGIIRHHGKILICKRKAGGSCAFLWEFPGGKLESGETKAECLIRECREELDIVVKPESICYQTTYRYPDKELSLTFFYAVLQQGEPKTIVHSELAWVFPEQLTQYSFCPANLPLMEALIKGEVLEK